MNNDVATYNKLQSKPQRAICERLATLIQAGLSNAENKVWHGGPVWFIDDNPIVGYFVRTTGNVQLLFWSGQSFNEPGLKPEGTFKAAEVQYSHVDQIHEENLARWLAKAQNIQWDYKNIVKRKGVLERLK